MVLDQIRCVLAWLMPVLPILKQKGHNRPRMEGGHGTPGTPGGGCYRLPGDLTAHGFANRTPMLRSARQAPRSCLLY